MIQDLKLTKDHSELLASRLKEKNLLQKGVRISLYCKHSQMLFHFSKWEMNSFIAVTLMVYFKSLNRTGVKDVLLHIGNQLTSVPVAYSMIF